jgi:hypothetical protein
MAELSFDPNILIGSESLSLTKKKTFISLDAPNNWKDWFTGDEGLEDQMRRQSDAAKAAGRTVEWHFAEKSVADFFRVFVELKKMNNIVVIFTPPRLP